MILALAVPVALASPGLLPTQEDTLANGLRIVAHSWPDAPEVALKLLLPAGAAADPPGRSGLAHLVEHVSFEGSAHAPDNAYDTWLRAAGGTNDAATSHDHVVYSVTAPPEALSLALFLESDRLGWLTPTAEALANQKDVVENERAESARADLVRRALAPLLWPAAHPYARAVIGEPDEVAAVRLVDVSRFVEQHAGPDGAVLVVVGPMEAEAMLAEARRWFGEVRPPGSTPRFPAPGALTGRSEPGGAPTAALDIPTPVDPQTAWLPTRVWVPGDVDRVRLRLAWRTVDRGHADRVALEIAGAVLADALVPHDVSVNAWSGRHGGELTLAADTDTPALVLRHMERAVSRLARLGPAEETLPRIRAMARAWELRGLQTAEGRAATLLGCVERTGAADCLPTEWAARETVSGDDVRAVARRWLTDVSRVLLAVAPASRGRPPLPRMTRGVPGAGGSP